jgi:phage terminase large subunit
MGPTYPQLKNGTLVAFDEWFHRAGMIIGKKDGNEPERQLQNGVTVYFRNASNPDQTRGHEYAVVWLDEAGQMLSDVVRLTTMTQRQRRQDMTFYRRQTIITTTPRGKNWIYKQFKDETSRQFVGHDKVDHFETTTLDAMKWGIAADTYVSEGSYTVGTLEYEQEILGRYVSYSGLVFYAFDSDKHYDRTYALPAFERVYGGIDIGQSAPTCLLLTGITASGRFVTFKEFYQRNCPEHVWMAKAAEWQKTYNVNFWMVDSAAKTEIATLRRYGVRAKPAKKHNDARATAVNFINSMLHQDRLIVTGCPNLLREVEGLEFKDALSGDEVTFLDRVKAGQDDHAVDSWCYSVPFLSAAVKKETGWGSIRFGAAVA